MIKFDPVIFDVDPNIAVAELKRLVIERRVAPILYYSRVLVEAFPDNISVVLESVAALTDLRCFGAADDILDLAARQFPTAPEIDITRANVLTDRSRWQDAIDIWNRLIGKHPDRTWGILGKVNTLRKMKDFINADIVLCEAREVFPHDYGVAWNWAFNCHYTQVWKIASARWAVFRSCWPEDGAGFSGGIFSARTLGQLDEAQALADQGEAAFSGVVYFASEVARLAAARKEWAKAFEIWNRLLNEHPNDEGVIGGLAQARIEYAQDTSDTSDLSSVRSLLQYSLLRQTSLQDQDLVLEFESLGRDCEFGLLQRALGQEPPGLFRWSATTAQNIKKGMDHRFEMMGKEETIDFTLIDGELYLLDRAYNCNMHTFIEYNEARMDAIKLEMMNRLSSLKLKMIECLESGKRIFIFKDSPNSEDFTILQLFESMKQYSDIKLLVVQKAKSDETPFSFKQWLPGLYVAKIDKFGNDGEGWNVPIQSWLMLCRLIHDDLFKPTTG